MKAKAKAKLIKVVIWVEGWPEGDRQWTVEGVDVESTVRAYAEGWRRDRRLCGIGLKVSGALEPTASQRDQLQRGVDPLEVVPPLSPIFQMRV